MTTKSKLPPLAPGGSPVKALSIRQPWAWLIVQGFKDIENRTRASHHRGPLLIHASKTMTRADYEACTLFLDATFDVHPENEFQHYHWTIPRKQANGERDLPTTLLLPSYDALRQECGGIVGAVEMTDCVTADYSRWYTGNYGYVMINPKVLPFRPCKGMLGFFNAPAADETYCQCCKRPAPVKPFLGGEYCAGCIEYAIANMEATD